MTQRTFLVDADVFISAKNRYYAFDICPGFWESLVHHSGGGVCSIDRVRSELLAGRPSEGALVVTNEQPRPDSRNRVLLPDVCAHFGVAYADTFHMLRRLNVRFGWRPTS